MNIYMNVSAGFGAVACLFVVFWLLVYPKYFIDIAMFKGNHGKLDTLASIFVWLFVVAIINFIALILINV